MSEPLNFCDRCGDSKATTVCDVCEQSLCKVCAALPCEPAIRTDSLDVRCPHCGATAGNECIGVVGITHQRRHDASRAAEKRAKNNLLYFPRECPSCRAGVGEPCHTRGGKRTPKHESRQ